MRIFSYFVLSLGILLLDQITKNFIVRNNFTFTFNFGIAFFSSFSALPVITVLLCFLFGVGFFILRHRNLTYNEFLALTMLLTGGFSNIIDRWQFGGVVDWISFGNFFRFNLADAVISLSVIILFYDVFSSYRFRRR